MIKISRLFVTLILTATALWANAQATATSATTSSPYSSFGIGQIDPSLLPQNIAMGGIATAINRISGYNNINPENPASYAVINYTTIDAGMYANITTLQQNQGNNVLATASNASFRLSHVVFGIPVTKRSALSFGLLPYSEMGYNYRISKTGFGSGSPADTNVVNYINSGTGGLSKAYLGYGYGITKHFFVGGNVSYIFGNLQQFQQTEIPGLYGTLNSTIEQDNHIGGFNFDFGAQYSFDFGEDLKNKHLILAYSASANNSLSSTSSYIVSQYTYDATGNQNVNADSLVNQQNAKSKIQLPFINHFGVSFQNDGKFLAGVDYTIGNWSSLTIDGVNAGLQNSKTFNIGGQYTPDINALHNYFARTDYRLGFTAEDTYVTVGNTDIKKYAVTFGFGLPLSPNLASFYKINFSTEIGQEGTLQNSLVRQKYVNIHLSFTVNDKWFQRYKFD
jgi:hypothetical protein